MLSVVITDTIASMTGAIVGATNTDRPDWPIQDREYIEFEAARMADIGSGDTASSFVYPDLISWSPPATQVDAVGKHET